MFKKEEQLREETRKTKKGAIYTVGVYACKFCKKEIYKTDWQAKNQSGYCIGCKNILTKTKKIQQSGNKTCKTCFKLQDVSQFTKNCIEGHPPNECNRCKNLRKFGLNSSSYDELLFKQNSCCALCNKPESAVVSRRKSLSLAVDHCHISNKIRGLLCCKCNMALGLLGDDVNLLQKCIDYLNKTKAS